MVRLVNSFHRRYSFYLLFLPVNIMSINESVKTDFSLAPDSILSKQNV